MKKLIVFLVFATSFIQASDGLGQQSWFAKSLGSFGQSSFICSCAKHLHGDPESEYMPPSYYAGQASEQYQALGIEAQKALGIPLGQFVPIIKMGKGYPDAKYSLAVATSDGIYVNEEFLDEMSYGAKRSIFMHEAAHVKYHDNITNGIVSLTSSIVGTIGTSILLSSLNIKTWHKRVSLIVGIAIFCKSASRFRQFIERRADIQGHYSTQCSDCISESIQSNKNHFLKFIKITEPDKKFSGSEILALVKDLDKARASYGGYLSLDELEKIAKDLSGKKCDYHSKQ